MPEITALCDVRHKEIFGPSGNPNRSAWTVDSVMLICTSHFKVRHGSECLTCVLWTEIARGNLWQYSHRHSGLVL